jgi:hypothetical protein
MVIEPCQAWEGELAEIAIGVLSRAYMCDHDWISQSPLVGILIQTRITKKELPNYIPSQFGLCEKSTLPIYAKDYHGKVTSLGAQGNAILDISSRSQPP